MVILTRGEQQNETANHTGVEGEVGRVAWKAQARPLALCLGSRVHRTRRAVLLFIAVAAG